MGLDSIPVQACAMQATTELRPHIGDDAANKLLLLLLFPGAFGP
jgi:hypothetical protein